MSAPMHIMSASTSSLTCWISSRHDSTEFHRDDAIRRWMTIVENEQDRLRQGNSVISPYGLTNPVEFFATAVEAFFQTPVALADRHAELYEFLSSYFCQDPAF